MKKLDLIRALVDKAQEGYRYIGIDEVVEIMLGRALTTEESKKTLKF